MLKGKDKFETLENFSILFIVVGAIMLSSGVGLTIISQSSMFAILVISGTFISFISIVALVFTWLAKELFWESEGQKEPIQEKTEQKGG
jgi:hypothetical protein